MTAALLATVAAFLHSRQAAPRSIDLATSSGLAIAFFALFVYLWLRPGALSIERASWLGFAI